MRAVATLVLLVMGFTGGSGSPSWAATLQSGDQDVINKYMADVADRVHGELPLEATPTVLTGDLNHDGVPDVAVLFEVDGPGNDYGQYLAVFLRVKGKLTAIDNAAVGGKFYRAVEMKSIQGDIIYLATTDYSAKDPACCPTIKGTTRYGLVSNKLKELGHS